MTKEQTIDAILNDLRGRLNVSLCELDLNESGEQEFYETLTRQYMNHPNDICAQAWQHNLSYCKRVIEQSAQNGPNQPNLDHVNASITPEELPGYNDYLDSINWALDIASGIHPKR